jgi:hypothetical protein
MFILYFLLGMIYVNFLEWSIHKHILHDLGKNKMSKFHFHIIHHFICSRNGLIDRASFHEAFLLILLSIIHIWLLYFSTWLYAGALTGCALYWIIHTKCHSDVDWMLTWVPWHYEHHTKFPDSNWCVTYPLFDIVFRTYKYD